MDRFSCRMEEIVERISELEERTIEIAQSKQQRENRLWKIKNVHRTCRTIIKDLTFVSLASWKERKKKAGLKEYLKK